MAETTAAAPPPAHREPVWKKRLVIGLVAVVVAVVGALIGSAFVPRWWAQRIGDQVNGSMGAGIGLGLLYGLFFTAVPLAVLYWTFRHRRPWKVWMAGVALAIATAAPNLMTLAIVIGNGNAAHAGERILDVEGPGYRYSVLAGAIVAVVGLGALQYLLLSRRRAKRRLKDVEGERTRERESAGAAGEG